MLRRITRRARPPRPRAERERRAGRVRRIAAIAVVGVLALGWFATARIGRTDALTPAPHTSAPGPTTTSRNSGNASWSRLLATGAQCHDQGRSGAATRCRVGGIDVDYRAVGPDLDAEYRAAVGIAPGPAPRATGSPACARGGEDERAWSRPTAPARVAGRYACRVEQGRAAMWWTVADRGLLAHATATNADLGSLFGWWESHSER